MESKIYSLSVDFNKGNDENHPLQQFLSQTKSCQCLERTWLVASEKSWNEVRDNINSYIREGDRYLLQELPADEYWGCVYRRYGTWEWIKSIRSESKSNHENPAS